MTCSAICITLRNFFLYICIAYEYEYIYISVLNFCVISSPSSNIPDKSDDEPVENLYPWDEAEAKTKSEQAAHAWDEVNSCHPQRPFIF